MIIYVLKDMSYRTFVYTDLLKTNLGISYIHLPFSNDVNTCYDNNSFIWLRLPFIFYNKIYFSYYEDII